MKNKLLLILLIWGLAVNGSLLLAEDTQEEQDKAATLDENYELLDIEETLEDLYAFSQETLEAQEAMIETIADTAEDATAGGLSEDPDEGKK